MSTSAFALLSLVMAVSAPITQGQPSDEEPASRGVPPWVETLKPLDELGPRLPVVWKELMSPDELFQILIENIPSDRLHLWAGTTYRTGAIVVYLPSWNPAEHEWDDSDWWGDEPRVEYEYWTGPNSKTVVYWPSRFPRMSDGLEARPPHVVNCPGGLGAAEMAGPMVGATPEPATSTLGLMALSILGGASLRRWRRARRVA